MQLTKLEIKGFKSFGDKITINFNEGVTAVVGPNGCGKSNVVDAIRWVLGEQSTRMLRSEKMENIIFNGTTNRKPANLAEVSLTFENSNNTLTTDFTTVNITRKLYRNGDSEYRLNDVKCRLKDITDLLLDTGLGSDSYSIIELKMIDEIINNKDNSRRNLFEEASGIAKYKVRKKQTLTKLRETEADLARVDDLVYEITKNLKQLESQAKKADTYFRLRNEYKDASVGLAYHRLAAFSTDLEHIVAQEEDQKSALTETAEQLVGQEQTLLELRDTIVVKEQNLSQQQKSTNEFLHKIRNYETDKKLQKEQVRHLEDKELRLATDLESDKQQLQHLQQTGKRLHEDLAAEQLKLDAYQVELHTNKAEVEELRGQQHSAKAKLDSFVKNSSAIQQQVFSLEKDLAVLAMQKESLDQEAQRTFGDNTSQEEELAALNQVVGELTKRQATQQQQLDTAMQMEDTLQDKIRHAEEERQQIKDELIRQSRTIDAKQNEYNLTKSLVDNLEGYPESIKFLRKNAGWKKSYPLFSDILFCDEDYRIAIENFFEPIMNHYVIDTQKEAVQSIQLLSDSARGRANFFVLDAIQELETKPLRLVNEQLTPAMDVITVDNKYRKLVNQLLQNVYLLKTEDAAPLTGPLPQDDMILLHSGGKFAKTKLGLSGGSLGLFEGKRIGRAKNLELLAKELKSYQQKISDIQKQDIQISKKIEELKISSHQAIIDQLRIVLNRLNNELITASTKQEQQQNIMQNNHGRKHVVEEKIISIREALEKNNPELQQLKEQQQNQDQELAILEENAIALFEELTEKTTLFNEENIRYHQQKSKIDGLLKDVEFRETQLESLAVRVERNTIELQEVQISLKDAVQYVDPTDDELVAMHAQKERLENGLALIEKEVFAARNAIHELETSLAQLRRNKDQSDLLLAALKDKKADLQIDLSSLKERLSVEFNIDIKTMLEAELPALVSTPADLSARCEQLKTQLDSYGSINPMAKESYDEINERHAFIQKEKSDLKEAKSTLMATITEIDQTANAKFMHAFNTVRKNFINVFRSLFNDEDSCDMVLTDPHNPLESDIDIIAQPKGKRPLSINQLSGGEKTLTATALLFSLYLLKPAPFCIFDEVDAPLDDNNIDKFNNIIRDFSKNSQFIVVSHNKRTIASTDIIYGVTMVEQGVSRVVAVDIRDVA